RTGRSRGGGRPGGSRAVRASGGVAASHRTAARQAAPGRADALSRGNHGERGRRASVDHSQGGGRAALSGASDTTAPSRTRSRGLADGDEAAMPVNLIPEENLRTALRPCRVDPLAFEAAVRRRLEAAETGREDDPLAGLSPLLRGVAGLLPLPLITGCKTMGT